MERHHFMQGLLAAKPGDPSLEVLTKLTLGHKPDG